MGNWAQYVRYTQANSTELVQTRDVNDANEITDISATYGTAWVDPAYDAAGNMTAGPKPGSTADGAARHWLVYDAWNRLTAVYEDDDDDGLFEPATDAALATYEYDGLHRRVEKVDKTGAADVEYDYYYNTQWQVLEVRADDDNAYPQKQYVWDLRYIDAPICRVRDADTDGDLTDSGDGTLYYTNDANMNVTALVEPDGDVVERYAYDAYGRLSVLDSDWSVDADEASDWGNEILYCGYRRDLETGYHQVRFRYYDPGVGRWVQRDPLDYIDGMNASEYVGSRPTRFSDSLGLVSQQKCEQEAARKLQKNMEEGKTVFTQFWELRDSLVKAGVSPFPQKDVRQLQDLERAYKQLKKQRWFHGWMRHKGCADKCVRNIYMTPQTGEHIKAMAESLKHMPGLKPSVSPVSVKPKGTQINLGEGEPGVIDAHNKAVAQAAAHITDTMSGLREKMIANLVLKGAAGINPGDLRGWDANNPDTWDYSQMFTYSPKHYRNVIEDPSRCAEVLRHYYDPVSYNYDPRSQTMLNSLYFIKDPNYLPPWLKPR